MTSLSWTFNARRMFNGLYEMLRTFVYSTRGMAVHRLKIEADRAFLGALQRSLALFETGAMIPEVIGKSWIALDGVPTAGTFVPLECVPELPHISSSLRVSFAPHRARSAQLPRGL